MAENTARRRQAMMLFIVLFAMAPFIIWKVMNAAYDTDVFFLISTGREILRNGMPYVNAWTAEPGLGIVVQQWLYAAATAVIYDSAGYVGLNLFVAAQVAVLSVIAWRLLGRRMRPWLKAVSIGMCLLLFGNYIFSVRPECITIILLLLECLCLEHGVRQGKRWLLYLLPVLVIAEMQVHMSMWLFHLCIMAAYIVPVFWLPHVSNIYAGRVRECAPYLCGAALLSVIGSLLNPYGLSGTTYLIDSGRAKTFSFVSVTEMGAPAVLSVVGVVFCVFAVLAVIAWTKRTLSGHALNMLAGFGILSMLAYRNMLFLFLPVLFVMRDAAEGFFDELTATHVMRRPGFWANAICAVLLCWVIPVTGIWQAEASDGQDIVSELSTVCDYLDEHADFGTPIFTGFNTGAYLEFRGYEHIYLDARPELYTQEMNGGRDVLADYARFVTLGRTPVIKKGMTKNVLQAVELDELESWLDEYGFEYVLLTPASEPYLTGYMLGSSNFVRVDMPECMSVVLYERIGGEAR